jgi:hypothetical protein
MSEEDEEARKARAARLRKQIDLLREKKRSDFPDQPPDPESPREFIERRMREIDSEEQASTESPEE